MGQRDSCCGRVIVMVLTRGREICCVHRLPTISIKHASQFDASEFLEDVALALPVYLPIM